MTDDPQFLMWLLAGSALLAVALGWLLARRVTRGRAALAIGLTMGVIAALFFGAKIGLLAAVCGGALAAAGATRGFVPTSLEEVAEAARDGKSRRWGL